jgi:2-polyprenyl-3-methyl-5-hydroxy-6-metoxy-1,4-benzoquinol methylase
MDGWQHNTSSARETQYYYNDVWTRRSTDLDYTQVFRARFIVEAIAELVPKDRRLSILDIGCGRGWMSPFLSPLGKVVGVDFSPNGIEFARKNYAEYGTFYLAEPDHPRLGLPDTNFDVIVCSEVIEHVPDQASFLQQMVSMLNVAGWLVMTTPNGNVWEEFRAHKVYGKQLQPLENWVTPDELRNLLAEAGFEVVRHEGRPVHSFRHGRTAPLQTERMHRLATKLGLQQLYYRTILSTALYQMVAAKRMSDD